MKSIVLALTFLFSAAAQAVCSVNVICAKDYFIDTNNYTGQVLEVFTNGHANVKYDYFGVKVAAVKNLTKAVRCHQGICMKDRVIRDSAVGTVMSVYANGKTYVKYDRYGWQLAHTSQLSKAVKP